MQKCCYFDSIFVSYIVLLLLFSDGFNKMLIEPPKMMKKSKKTPKIKIQNLLSLTRCFNLDPMRNVTASSCWFCVNLLCSMAMAVQKVHFFVPSYVYVCGRIFSFCLSV